ncbi:Polar amino acid transport system substrate-binding protein OS=Castellaniella defragrans OX=75697 GN=HNR28_002470 PE=4 SV=1 [Castellaniella defragrans]
MKAPGRKTIVAIVKACAALSAAMMLTAPAQADKLDDIINAGVVKCGVMLDYPPLGFYNDKHEPVGYSVDWCKDLAAALGVKAQIVDTPSAERIPALISGRVDVSIANASNTLERAKTVLFTIPYYVDPWATVTRKGTGVKSFSDLKGRTVGDVRGAVPANIFKQYNDEQWKGASKLSLYGDDASKVLALEQGKIDGFITNLSNARQVLSQYKDFEIVGSAPFAPDVTAMMVRRGEFGLVHWLNLFIYQQVRQGEYAKIYKKWLVGEASEKVEVPPLSVEGVYY